MNIIYIDDVPTDGYHNMEVELSEEEKESFTKIGSYFEDEVLTDLELGLHYAIMLGVIHDA